MALTLKDRDGTHRTPPIRSEFWACVVAALLSAMAGCATTCPPTQPCLRALPDPSAPWPVSAAETQLTLVHLTDTHVGKVPETPDGPIDDAEAFQAVIQRINAMEPQPDLTLITGDLTDAWKSDQITRFKALALDTLRSEVLVASGNHDVGFDPRPEHITEWLIAFPEATLPQVTVRGPVAFIGFDSQVYNARRTGDAVDAIAEAQWERLVAAVAKARRRGKRVMLYSHIPALPSFFRDKVRASWKGQYLPRFLALLRDHQVEASLTGHFHRDELYARGPTLFLNAPPVSRWETRDTSYRVIKVTAAGLVYRQIYVGPEAATRSYQADLRGVTEAGVTAWVGDLDGEDLRALWERRYAGDDASERLYGDLEQAVLRDFLTRPFDYQPEDDDTTWFGERRE